MFSEILFDLLDIFSWFIDLGDGDDNRHTGFFSMSDRFYRLWHHAIVSGYNDNSYIRQFRSSGSQTSE